MKFDRRIFRLLSRFILGSAIGVSCFSFNCVSAMEGYDEFSYKKSVEIMKYAIARFVENYVFNHSAPESYSRQQIINLYEKITSDDFKSQIQNYKPLIIKWIDENYRSTEVFKNGETTESDIALAKKIWTNLSDEDVIDLVRKSEKQFFKSN